MSGEVLCEVGFYICWPWALSVTFFLQQACELLRAVVSRFLSSFYLFVSRPGATSNTVFIHYYQILVAGLHPPPPNEIFSLNCGKKNTKQTRKIV